MKIVGFKKEDWNYLCSKINWKKSNMDAKAISIMNNPINSIPKNRVKDILINTQDDIKDHTFDYICEELKIEDT